MLKEETEYNPVRSPSKLRGFFVSRVKTFVGVVVFVALLIVLIALAVMLAHEKRKEQNLSGVKNDDKSAGKQSAIKQSVHH